MISSLEKHAGDMWDGQAYEGDGATKSGDCSGQQAGIEDDEHSGFFKVETHGFGIVFTKKQKIQWCVQMIHTKSKPKTSFGN